MAEIPPTILFVTPVLGHPAKGGPQLRIENSLKALSQIAALHLFSRDPEYLSHDETVRNFHGELVRKIYIAPSCRIRNILFRSVRHAAHLIFRFVTGHSLKELLDYHSVLKTANKINADVIWLGYGNISYPLLDYLKSRTSIPVVLDTDSVWSRFMLRGLPYAKDDRTRAAIESEGRAKEEEETRGTKLADVTTAVSDVDARFYRSLAESPEKVHIFSNAVDMSCYYNVPPPPDFNPPTIFLAGSFGRESPMEDAALWLINEILPLIRLEIPEIRCYIAGTNSREVLSEICDPNVIILGEVESVLPYLSHTTVSVVPLRFESGTRFKILEAGACGIPVVSTALGAEGIAAVDGEHILIADSPEQFARSTIRVTTDRQLASRLGQNLHTLVDRHYSLDTLIREGLAILAYLDRSFKQRQRQ